MVGPHDLYKFACRKGGCDDTIRLFFKRGPGHMPVLIEIELFDFNIEYPGHVGTCVQGLFMNDLK